jgi:hypothetical protein
MRNDGWKPAMQEIGVWITEAGPVSASLEYAVQDVRGEEFQLPTWASGALQGAAAGAATGAVAGPYGALIGGALGALGGATTATAAPPAPAQSPPQQSQPAAPPKAAPSAPAGPAAPAAGAPNAALVQALQQFAAAMPALIQIVAASGTSAAGPKRPESGQPAATGEAVFASEAGSGAEWVLAANQPTWTVP